MKKLIALLLVLCLTMGLVACSKPATDPTGNATGSNNSTEGGNNEETGGRTDLPDVTSPINTGDSDEPNSNDKYINPDFAGKTLEIWGVSGAVYEDIENMGNGSFLWMMRAAVADWAALNDVTVEFKAATKRTQLCPLSTMVRSRTCSLHARSSPASQLTASSESLLKRKPSSCPAFVVSVI